MSNISRVLPLLPVLYSKSKNYKKKLSNAGKIFQIILKAMLMSTLTSYTVQN